MKLWCIINTGFDMYDAQTMQKPRRWFCLELSYLTDHLRRPPTSLAVREQVDNDRPHSHLGFPYP